MTMLENALDPRRDDSCPFCAIARGQVPAERLMHWGDCLAITPLNPVTPGHVLVIPTIHVRDALEVPAVTGLAFNRAADFAARNTYGAPGFNLITSVGPAATQTVGHLHVHVVPRRPGDGLKLPWSP